MLLSSMFVCISLFVLVYKWNWVPISSTVPGSGLVESVSGDGYLMGVLNGASLLNLPYLPRSTSAAVVNTEMVTNVSLGGSIGQVNWISPNTINLLRGRQH